MIYTASRIAALVHGNLLADAALPEALEFLVTDSRKIVHPARSVFFAIRGEYQDGHRFLRQAYDAGIRCFVVSNLSAVELMDAAVIRVPDTLQALQQLAAAHRAQFHIPVIGITGSNGKTIVKDWLFHLLSIDKKVVRSPKSYNSQVGVPLSVWGLHASDEVGVFEAGISQPGEMDKLEPIIHPGIGIFTNIGAAHAENFTSIREKAAEKFKLFRHCHTLIYCKDHPVIHEWVQAHAGPERKDIAWSWSGEALYAVRKMNGGGNAVSLEVSGPQGTHLFPVPFADAASLENMAHCIVTLLTMGYTAARIAPGIASLQRNSMRLEMKRGRNNCTLINDSYSADLDSLRIALEALGQLNQHQRRSLVLSDILQSGLSDAQLYTQVGAMVRSHKVNRVIGVGKHIAMFATMFPEGSRFFDTTDALLEQLPALDFRDEDILIKGARVFEFERISRRLEERVHQTVLEINLNAMVHNLNVFRRRLSPGTRLMVMVKASSYGTGSFEIANLLQYYKVDYLAVAYTDEGVNLRNHGITLPIMVMSPENNRYDLMAEYNLEPEIYSAESLEAYLAFASGRLQVPGIHIKVDTGMHRLGFQPDKADAVAGRMAAYPQIRIQSVFSHLAAGDDPAEDEATRKQIAALQLFADRLSEKLDYVPLRHILNSGGIQRFPEAQMDMVRLGVGLYGVGVNTAEQQKLEQVIRLKTTVSQVHQLKAGDRVGYGFSHICRQDTTIATVPVGYADGLRRALGNGKGKMEVKGVLAPIAGRVCMDMTMLDVTGLDVQAGDEVTVIGDLYSIHDMARDLGTIPYEVLTAISERVKRVYVQE